MLNFVVVNMCCRKILACKEEPTSNTFEGPTGNFLGARWARTPLQLTVIQLPDFGLPVRSKVARR